jgi:hypothetical protein
MKTLLSAAVGCCIALASSTAFAQPKAYRFTTVDISVPERPDSVAIPEDISDAGTIVTNVVSSSHGIEAVIAEQVRGRQRFATTLFQCAVVPFATSQAVAINGDGDVVGTCDTTPNDSNIHGFIRDRQGDHILLDFPGADHTLPLGISSEREVVGFYYNPLEPNQSGLFRIHGFKWSNGSFETIDFPLANIYTILKSINTEGRIIGEYYRFDPATNATLEHNWFVYEEGEFLLDFPPSLEWNGGPALFLADINDSGQIVALRSNAGPDWDGVFVFEDGEWNRVTFPRSYAYVDVRGMNNRGQFVGMYLKQVGTDPFYGSPLYELHGYVATPTSRRKPTSTTSDDATADN